MAATLSTQSKKALQELLKSGCIEQQIKPESYRHLLADQDLAQEYLSALDLTIQVDEVRGLIFTVVSMPNQAEPLPELTQEAQEMLASAHTEDEWSHPLIRRQRLTLEQSLLLALLRQRFVEVEQQQGIGSSQIMADLDDLQSHFSFLLDKNSGSDSKDRERLIQLLKQLAEYGVVGAINDTQVLIRPLIVHLANPENLSRLLNQLKTLSAQSGVKV